MAHRSVALLLVPLLLLACRDEQAGPRVAPTRSASAQTPASPPISNQPPTGLTYRSGVTLGGGAIVYLGSKVEPPSPRPGQTVTLTHYFQSTGAPPQGWDYFTHVVDGSGGMVVNADHPFANGALPMSNWPAGKVVADTHTLAMPSQPVRVLLGFWQGDSRLAVDSPRGHDGANRLLGPVLKGGAPPVPEYEVPKTAHAPTIDGVPDEAAWKSAPEVVLKGSLDGREVTYRTTARLLYDDAHLYVAFDGEDRDVWGELLKRDEPIYNEEVFEIFLDANADGRTYNELQVSPNNVVFDAYFPARRQGMDTGWDSQVKTAVNVRGTLNDDSDEDEGWSAELRIPFATLAEVPNVPPKPGEAWRFNLYRLEHLTRRKNIEGQSFSPLFVGDFHALPRFGILRFGS